MTDVSESPVFSQETRAALPLLVCINRAPGVFGISKSHIYRIGKNGDVTLKKMGSRTMVVTETMLAYIESLQPMTPSNP
ncbi:hypothetical protein K2X14_00275 [Acetobacter sp. TBRC 12305]|uniref:Helix-turn-helix domain-containing protein n=1 Tax=Acetobacter garciniae TaxID=2817435 RepID=A0A939KLM0_9PROT|nr:hypothetical protein [Acetobacter garciniae]MBO1323590.1 hypothetical protein [Acetobacter garciniae]MBX0343279.1 hypothetical protein [Acetobacter garciniae]